MSEETCRPSPMDGRNHRFIPMTGPRPWLGLALALLLTTAGPAGARETSATRYRLKVLPFTGLTLPHQQVSDYHPALTLGMGFEALYTPRVALSLDGTVSWHGGGPSGRGDLRLSSLQLVGRWRFPDRVFEPFLQAGVGGYQAKQDGSDGERSFGAAGATFGFGGEQPLSEKWALQLDVRTNVVHGSGDESDREAWIGHTQGLLWVVYRLP